MSLSAPNRSSSCRVSSRDKPSVIATLILALWGGAIPSGCIGLGKTSGPQGNATPVTIVVNPSNTTVVVGEFQQFLGNVAGTLNTGVTWTVRGAGCSGSSCGALAASASSAVYVAPIVAPSPPSITLVATSTTDPTKSASASITIVPKVLVNVAPGNTSVPAGSTQQFSASVTGTPNTGVAWTLSGSSCSGPACGTISGGGRYTAPSSNPLPLTVVVTATSISDAGAASSALISIVPAAAPTSSSATPPAAAPIGINMSEGEYSWGSFADGSDVAYLRSNNISLVRLPIAWERVQTTLGGPLNQTYLAALTSFISTASAHGMRVIVDVHNYGRYNRRWAQDAAANYGYVAVGKGDVIGSPAVPISAFVDLWTKLAGALKGTPGLTYYDIMNEPYDMGATNSWPSAAQAAVNAIRLVDMDTSILVEGTQWASARWWPSDNGSLNINDPANKLLYEAHLYFDSDGSGNYLQSYAQDKAYPTIGVDRLQPFLTWLTQNKAKGFLGEFGIPGNDPQWLPVLDNFLTALQDAGLSGTYWDYVFHSPSDPSWWPANDTKSIRSDNGQANPQMSILLKHNPPSP
jgi:aryl-phospho-beta-D-glucosidase BglC (GH1 family)